MYNIKYYHYVSPLYLFFREYQNVRVLFALYETYMSHKEVFGRFGMRTNVVKTVIMTFQPCVAIGGYSVESYGLRMM